MRAQKDRLPRLTRLNTSDWNRAMAKARKANQQLAFDLADAYTRRASRPKGIAIGKTLLAT